MTGNASYSGQTVESLETLLRQRDLSPGDRREVEEELTRRLSEELLNVQGQGEQPPAESSSTPAEDVEPERSPEPEKSGGSGFLTTVLVIAGIIILLLLWV